MDNWKKEHDEYVAKSIIRLGPSLCKEYLERDYNNRHCHGNIAGLLGDILGNPTANVNTAFYLSRNKAQELVNNSRIDSPEKNDLPASTVERLEKTLGKYQMVEKIAKAPKVFGFVKDFSWLQGLGEDYNEHMTTYAALVKNYADKELQ